MLENEVRKWVKRSWAGGPHLTWGEAGRGGTVGAADLLVPVGKFLMPVELKVCATSAKVNQHGVLAVWPKLRPSQLLYHRQLIKSGLASGYLFGFETWEAHLVGFCSMAKVVDAVMNEKFLTDDDFEVIGALKPFTTIGDWRKIVSVFINAT